MSPAYGPASQRPHHEVNSSAYRHGAKDGEKTKGIEFHNELLFELSTGNEA